MRRWRWALLAAALAAALAGGAAGARAGGELPGPGVVRVGDVALRTLIRAHGCPRRRPNPACGTATYTLLLGLGGRQSASWSVEVPRSAVRRSCGDVVVSELPGPDHYC